MSNVQSVNVDSYLEPKCCIVVDYNHHLADAVDVGQRRASEQKHQVAAVCAADHQCDCPFGVLYLQLNT